MALPTDTKPEVKKTPDEKPEVKTELKTETKVEPKPESVLSTKPTPPIPPVFMPTSTLTPGSYTLTSGEYAFTVTTAEVTEPKKPPRDPKNV